MENLNLNPDKGKITKNYGIFSLEKFKKDRTAYFLELDKYILNNVNLGNNSKYLITFSDIFSAYAISKAEDSELIFDEAVSIFKNTDLEYKSSSGSFTVHSNNSIGDIIIKDKYQKQREKILSEITNIKNTDENNRSVKSIKKLYNKLEFLNILGVSESVKSDEFLKIVKEFGISGEMLCNIHKELTIGLDEFNNLGIESFWRYYPGVLRSYDDISVGGKMPDLAASIPENLQMVNDLTKKVKTIDDIFEIHTKMYRSHFFRNGNKRLSRVVENILLSTLGFSSVLTPNIGYHLNKSDYKKALMNYSINEFKPNSFKYFANSEMILSAVYLLNRDILKEKDTIVNRIRKNNSQDIKFNILRAVPNKNEIKSKDLINLYNDRYNRIPERTFFSYLDKELNTFSEIVKRREEGKNVFYSMDFSKNTLLIEKIDALEDLKDVFLNITGKEISKLKLTRSFLNI